MKTSYPLSYHHNSDLATHALEYTMLCHKFFVPINQKTQQ